MTDKEAVVLTCSINTFILRILFFSLTIIAISLLACKSYAQSPVPEYNLDSLIKVSGNYKAEDLNKLRMLIMISKGYEDVNPTKGIEIADQAYTLAKKLNDLSEQAAAIHYKAANIGAKSDAKQALSLFEQALKINKDNNNQYGVSLNLRGVGNCYYSLSDFKNAKKYFEESLDISEKLNDEIGMAANLSRMGAVCNELTDYPMALEYHQKALSINERLNNKRAMAINLANIGNVYRNLSEYTKTLEYHQRSLGINEQLGNKSLMANNLNTIGNVYFLVSDYSKAMEYYQKALAINENLGNKRGMATNLGNIGNVYDNLSDYPKALEFHQKAFNMFEQLANKSGMAGELGNIGNVYIYLSDYPKALEYHQKALSINEQLGNKSGIANNLGNIGISYNSLSNYNKALEYFQKALNIYEPLGNKRGMAINLDNLGEVCLSQGDYPKALDYYEKALHINEQQGNKKGIAKNLTNLGNFYGAVSDQDLKQMGIDQSQRFPKALEYLNRSVSLAKEIGDVETQKIAWEKKSLLFEKHEKFIEAYEAYKIYVILRDSIMGVETQIKIKQKEMQFEFDKKETQLKYEKQLSEEKVLRQEKELLLNQKELGLRQQALALSNKEKDLQRLEYLKEKAEKEKQLGIAEKDKQLQASRIDALGKEKEIQNKKLALSLVEIEKKSQQRNLFIAGMVLMILLAGSIFMGLKRTFEEKKRSDELLMNILPKEVAEELKLKGEADAKLIDGVTVLFTDFKEFTKASAKLSAAELVGELNHCYKAFDKIVEKYGIEKIKTIGDAYMAAGGIPAATANSVENTVLAALEMQDFIAKRKIENESIGKQAFEMRAGIHTGPVVAGIVGVKKFQYDIWGNTVNLANRMEASGEIGKVNISRSTYELVKDRFTCEYRGEVEAKGQDKMGMYFVSAHIERSKG